MNLEERVSLQNTHWSKGEFLTFLHHRHLFGRIWQDIDTKPIVVLSGPRRSGKSIILKQLVNKLIKTKSLPATQILLFEFSPRDTLETIWTVMKFFLGQIARSNQPRFAFFDEIQYISGFESVIKEMYDQENVKLAVTGSLSLSYKRPVEESLGGRFFAYRLFPLSFQEYLEISESPHQKDFSAVRDNTASSVARDQLLKELNAEFVHFLSLGRLPEMLFLNEIQARAYLSSVSGQALTQDAFNYFSIEKPQTLFALYEYIRAKSGGIISTQSLSQNTGANAETVKKYLTVLELMGLVYPVYNSLNPIAKLNSAKKMYVNSMYSLSDTNLDLATALGFAAESYILERLLEKGETVTFFHQRQKEIDFVLPQKKIAYEVKFRSQFSPPKPLPGYVTNIISLNGPLPVCVF